MNKTIFISYHFNDRGYKGEVVAWLEQKGARIISVDEKDLRPEGNNVIQNKIKQQIEESNILLVLVGNDTHNRPWVDYEVAVAKSKGVKTFWVRLSGRTGAAPREVRNVNPVAYNRPDIQNLLQL